MRITGSAIVACLLALAVTGLTAALPATPASKVERGRCLVEQVAMCGDCHTPHTEKGEPIREQWLQGSPLFFKPSVPMPVWADKAPNIAGLPGWEDKDAIKFLMTGLAYNDLSGRPPMPQYRFNQEDAAAIVAYLRTLVPADGAGHPRK